MAAEQRCSAASLIIDAHVTLIWEEIANVTKSFSQVRIRQRIVEEIEEFADADQGQSAFESQPSVFRADMSRTGAGVVSESSCPRS